MSIRVDVLVCGGGCAGLAAATAAARGGAQVLLVERAPFCGGIISNVGLPSMDGISCWATGRILVRGLPLELLARLSHCSPDVRRIEDIRTNVNMHRHGAMMLDSIERFKLIADDVLNEAGVKIMYHALACGVETKGGRISSVTLANKAAGLLKVEPQVVVDCTGDADVAHYADCPMDGNPARMPMTLHFRIGNVSSVGDREIKDAAAEALALAQRDGKLPMYYGPGLCRPFAPDEIYVHAVRVPGDALDPFDLSRAEMQGRRDAWTMFEYWKKFIPAFKDSYFIGGGPYIGVRETRRIFGQYVLNENDVLHSRPFDDAIATGCWYMDLHPNKATPGAASDPDDPHVPQHCRDGWGKVKAEAAAQKEAFESGVSATPKDIAPPKPYDIPFRSLLPRSIENLIVAGRCHSATRSAAGSTRVTVTAMAMGEAAGVAAALSLKQRTPVGALNGVAVREQLAANGGGPFTRVEDLAHFGGGSS